MRDCKLGRSNDRNRQRYSLTSPRKKISIVCLTEYIFNSPLDLTLATSQGNLTYKRL
jgi:hypothetical protein